MIIYTGNFNDIIDNMYIYIKMWQTQEAAVLSVSV